ncbi:MAG TPA: PRC-barrel domain-containing protein [Gemmatimonadaceae bacterium]|jgi:sporulation protein YlmC with PRC-barrel domain
MVVNETPLSPREIHVEALIGRALRDADGQKVGRIEELVVEQEDTDWVVVEIHVGVGALVERVVELSTLVPLMGALGKKLGKRFRVPWHELDLTDPDHPRAIVRLGELKRLER